MGESSHQIVGRRRSSQNANGQKWPKNLHLSADPQKPLGRDARPFPGQVKFAKIPTSLQGQGAYPGLQANRFDWDKLKQ